MATPSDDRFTGRARVSSRASTPTLDRPPVRPPRRRIRPRWGRIALVLGVAVALVISLGMVVSFLWAKKIDEDLRRADPFSQISGGRPHKLADGSLNVLLLGSDSREPDAPVG